MTAPFARLALALLVVAIWAAITLGSTMLVQSSTISLQELITRGLAWGVAAAALFLVAATWLAGWRDLGFRKPRPMSSLRLLWLPVLYLLALGATGALAGRLGMSAIIMVAINTALVGFSEELAFRGVLWGAARKALSFWPGFLLVSAAFGSVHIFNALITGELSGAGVQALNAFMSGCAYLAIRIRTRSIIPIMIIHATWDFVVFLTGSGADPAPAPPDAWMSQLMFGLMLTGPLFLYGLWLVRNEQVRAGWRDDSYDPTHPKQGEMR
ncbi:CPBP family intramembrane glutamic endopeptidase [Blastomonas sp.]|uniref:CPBP family intramembrane glutamic endopeptidase n=1 Tax=Blastomonas sp. TaxID=1909299 RepID=UPI00261C53D7|nr:CPBP family intramembrane glutamic endopeptidase [Blastomonas sp.]MDM7956072.1 CPBP family intramembrane metalloprotease [Blastomonas sp.]